MVLWVSGLLPVMLEELDQIKWKVGGSTLSVRTMLEGALTAGVVLLITLWISSAIESAAAALGHRQRAVPAQGGEQRHARRC